MTNPTCDCCGAMLGMKVLPCEFCDGSITNQYALGYKAGLEAAVKVCRGYDASVWSHCNASSHAADMVAATLSQAIAALPVPEFQWLDLTDDEVEEVCRSLWSGGWRQKAMNDFANAAIAKFKEKQL